MGIYESRGRRTVRRTAWFAAGVVVGTFAIVPFLWYSITGLENTVTSVYNILQPEGSKWNTTGLNADLRVLDTKITIIAEILSQHCGVRVVTKDGQIVIEPVVDE